MNMLYVIMLSIFLSCGLAYQCVDSTPRQMNYYFYNDTIYKCNNDDQEYQATVKRFANESQTLTSIVGSIVSKQDLKDIHLQLVSR